MCAVDAEMVGSYARARIAVASMVGTTVEFYDFYIYATAAVSVFPHLFFPKGNGTTAAIAPALIAPWLPTIDRFGGHWGLSCGFPGWHGPFQCWYG